MPDGMPGPMIVDTAVVRSLLQAIFYNYATPDIKRVDRSPNLIIPQRRFLYHTWQPYWNDIRDTELGENNGYFCELFASRACDEFHKLAFNHCKKNRGLDAGGGLFKISIDILKPPFMGIRAETHWTCLQAYTTNGKDIDFAFWEPQLKGGHILLPLQPALAAEDVIVKTIDL
jgi:hypothetical protein